MKFSISFIILACALVKSSIALPINAPDALSADFVNQNATDLTDTEAASSFDNDVYRRFSSPNGPASLLERDVTDDDSESDEDLETHDLGARANLLNPLATKPGTLKSSTSKAVTPKQTLSKASISKPTNVISSPLPTKPGIPNLGTSNPVASKAATTQGSVSKPTTAASTNKPAASASHSGIIKPDVSRPNGTKSGAISETGASTPTASSFDSSAQCVLPPSTHKRAEGQVVKVIKVSGICYPLLEPLTTGKGNQGKAKTYPVQGGQFYAKTIENPTAGDVTSFANEITKTKEASEALKSMLWEADGPDADGNTWLITRTMSGVPIWERWENNKSAFKERSACDDDMDKAKAKIAEEQNKLAKKGFIHADNHPGNWLVNRDGKDIVSALPIDFGKTSSVTDETKQGAISFKVKQYFIFPQDWQKIKSKGVCL